MKGIRTAAILAVALIAAPTFAQQGDIQRMDHSKMMNDPGNPYASAEMDMHRKMMAAKMGDAAEIWTRKMIEHHRGAIAMSQIAQRETKDAEARKMAAMTITEQEKNIAELQDWLKRHGKRPQ